MGKYWEHRNDINQLFNAPKYRRLKYSALTVIGICIAIQFVIIIWLDDIPVRARLFMQGCIGAGAIVFVVLVTIMAYQIFSDYFRQK